MKKFSAKTAKDEFGRLIDTAQREPVEIQKKGRPVAVVLSLEEYQRLETIENSWLIEQARKASKEGYIGSTESEKLMLEILNAKD